MSSDVFHASVPPSRIDAFVPMAPPHLLPILYAVRHHGVGWAPVPQRPGRFTIPAGQPSIVVLGDDLHEALGPTAFHRKSVHRVLAGCCFAAIISCEPLPEVYAQAAAMAVLFRGDVVIVETRPRWEADWHALVRSVNPDLPVTIATVRFEGTA